MRFYLITLFCCISNLAFSQKKKEKDTSAYLIQPDRIEFTMERTEKEFHIVNGFEEGMLVIVVTSNKVEGGNMGWVLHKLDTALEISWTKLAIVPTKYTLRGWDYSKGYYYLLFSRDQYKLENLSVYKIDAQSGHYEEIKLSTVFPLELSHFEAVNNTVLLGGTAHYRPAILTFDLDDPTPRVIPGIYDTKNTIVDITMDREAEVFSVTIGEDLTNKQHTVSVNTYTLDNLLIQRNTIDPGEKRHLIGGTATGFSNGFQYLAGTYSKKSVQYSRGLYLSKFVNGRQQFIKYYNYADLNSFFEYMGDSKEKRVKARISKRKAQGKINKFNYRLMIHEIIQRGNEYIMIGEAYYPRYSNYQTFMPYGTGNQNTNIVGYKYTHAIVVAFDQNGNILWDQSFPIEDVYTSYPEEKVTVNVLDDRIELLYLEENLIRSKVIKGDKVFEGESYTPVKLGSEKDEVTQKDPEVEGLKKWYGETLYAFGEQQIVHKLETTKGTRKVFYINKLRYKIDDSLF
jgi:hypothetical protein